MSTSCARCLLEHGTGVSLSRSHSFVTSGFVLGSTLASIVSSRTWTTDRRGRSQQLMSLANWKSPSKRTYEDGLLLEYWQALGGLIFAEVPVGRDGPKQWPEGARPRRIDGVRIVPPESEKTPSDIVAFSRGRDAKRFEELATGADVEVLEVKRVLDRVVLGQVIIGADLLEIEYAPTKIDQVVICEVGDPVLETVCERRGIKVWMPPKL